MHLPSVLLTALATLCASACIRTPGVDLITNGGFEDEKDSFAPWMNGNKGAARLTRPGFRSPQALQLVRSLKTYYNLPAPGSVYQDVNHCPNLWYTISWDQRIPRNKSHFSDIIPQAETLYTSYSSADVTSSNWTHHSYNYYSTTPTGSNAYITPIRGNQIIYEFIRIGSDRLLLDNVKVTALGDIAPVPRATELARNGDLENGQFTPWTQTNPKQCAVKSPGYMSRYSIHCRTTVYNGAYDDITLSHAFRTVRGTQYLLTGKLKITQFTPKLGVGDCPIQYYLQQYVFDVNALGMTPLNNTWTDIYQPFIADEPLPTFRARMYTVSNFGRTPDCEYLFDNLSVKKASLQ